MLTTPNLIIDLRRNSGGSDVSWRSLLPLLYTNPIRTVGMELLSTPLNNARMQELLNDPKYNLSVEDRRWAEEGYAKLSSHLGEFVNLDDERISVETFDTIYANPRRVVLLIDETNASSTEQFLLAARQSRKVKYFGHSTMGVLDISNMHFVDSPCGDFQLAYSLSKSFRIPDMTIDGHGIQPDYYIDDGVNAWEWIDFVLTTWKAGNH